MWGSCLVWYEGVGMAPPHGILTNKKYVLPTAVVGWEGMGASSRGGWERGWGVQDVTWVEELEGPAVCDPKCVVAGICPHSCLMKGHLPRWTWPP